MASIIRRPLNLTAAVRFRLAPLFPFSGSSGSVNSDTTRCSELIRVPSLVEGCDYKHWLVLMKPPKGYPPRNDIVRGFVKTLAMALGSEEEAKKSIYSVSTKYYYAFGCRFHEPLTYKIRCIDTDPFKISSSSFGFFIFIPSFVANAVNVAHILIAALPDVKWVLPDSFIVDGESGYGGEPFVNGEVVPYDEKYHADWLRDQTDEDAKNRVVKKKPRRKRK